eukprot:4412648-Alexandrium_andersonii.AAC.1
MAAAAAAESFAPGWSARIWRGAQTYCPHAKMCTNSTSLHDTRLASKSTASAAKAPWPSTRRRKERRAATR